MAADHAQNMLSLKFKGLVINPPKYKYLKIQKSRIVTVVYITLLSVIFFNMLTILGNMYFGKTYTITIRKIKAKVIR